MTNIFRFFLAFVLLGTSCRKEPEVPATEQPAPVADEAGLISWSPGFPAGDAEVTINFDATRGNRGLQDYAGDVYLYTGVITDKSTSPSDWKYVKSAGFNAPDPACKMTPTGPNRYRITLVPSKFYGVPSGERILKLAMLFRSGDGSRVGRNRDNGDIYMPLYEPGKLHVRFAAPETEPFYDPEPVIAVSSAGGELSVSGMASRDATLTLSLNGTTFAETTGDRISGKATISGTGNQVIRLVATAGNQTAEASFSFRIHGPVETAALPAGAQDGVTFINNGTSAIFSLFAPGKQRVHLLGDFNDWQAADGYALKRTPDGARWWIRVDNLDPQKEYAYQYLVDDRLRIADPYTEKVLDPDHDRFIPASTYPNLKGYPTGKTTGIVSTMHASQPVYAWKSQSFTRPAKKNLVIYELLVRDFVSERNFDAVRGKLDYLAGLGINAIELMPVQEFEGNSSWGYNPTFYFAPDKIYGTKNALKQFIDACHQRGIAVILDMVLNHSFGQSPMVQLYFDQAAGRPAADNPWFNASPTHPYNVGYDLNHEKPATRSFVKQVLGFWMEEYRVDGFRFDLSKGFTQRNSGTSDAATAAWSAYDAGRIAIWKDYHSFLRSVDPGAYVILEHFADDAEEKELAAEGMMLWNNLNHPASEATMGYPAKSDLGRAFSASHGFQAQDNLVTYMESHDEERLMYKTLQFGNMAADYSVRQLTTALKRQEMAAALFMAMPGPKMIWQFGELGYDVPIGQNGRTGEKPLHWEYADHPQRKALSSVYAKMIRMKTANAAFSSGQYEYDLAGGVKYISLKSASGNVVVVANFDVTSRSASIPFPAAGRWTDQLSGGVITTTGGPVGLTLAPGAYFVYSDTMLNAH